MAPPMKTAVLGSLAMTFAWGVIAGSVGLNALIKSNQEKSRLRRAASPIIVNINSNDIRSSGIVLTTVTALIAVLSLIFLLMFLIRSKRPLLFSSRFLRIQALLMAFTGTWLFATLIPYTLFFATRHANVTARLGNTPIPQSVIQQSQQALGATTIYKEIGYLRLVAILPWITLLFTFISAGVLFSASSRARAEEQAAPAGSYAETETKDGRPSEAGATTVSEKETGSPTHATHVTA